MYIRKLRDDVQKNREKVGENQFMDEVTRGALGGISLLGSLLLVLWIFRGKIKHLQNMRLRTIFPLPMVNQQTPPFQWPTGQVQQPAFAPTVCNY